MLEEAPERTSGPGRSWQLLLLSARTSTALASVTERLARHLAAERQNLADVAFTLAVGRKAFAHRRIAVCRERQDAAAVLAGDAPERLFDAVHSSADRPVAFLFPGQGAQRAGMARGLWAEEPTFRLWIERAAEILAALGIDLLKELDFATEPPAESRRLEETAVAQPALFAVEYALGQLFLEWGIRPAALLGHSVGEYVAACLAEVLSFSDALSLVAVRGRLMQGLARGAMLAVPLAEEEVRTLLGDELAMAAVNGPQASVVSGSEGAIEALAAQLEREGRQVHRLRTSHAFHSAMMDPILDAFASEVSRIDLKAPQIPYLSGVTGTWITTEQATDPGYWVRHLRQPVRFGEGLATLLEHPDRILLELGPGETLSTLARQHPVRTAGHAILPSLPRRQDPRADLECALGALGRLWLAGAEVDWEGFYARERRLRVSLPTYPFERRRHWIDMGRGAFLDARLEGESSAGELLVEAEPAERFGQERVAPQSDTERRLARIWSDLLGVAEISLYDDFFELGGSSMLAIRLGSRLRQELGVNLPPDFLLGAPTLRGMAALLTAASSGSDGGAPERAGHPCVVELHPGNGNGLAPFFLIHPVGGHAYFYRGLARELGGNQPIFGLRAHGLEEGEEPLGSIEEVAAHYLPAIREKQPRGPFLLGGSSLGGIVAYEMAQQLYREGEEVSLLAMMDSPGPGQMPKSEENDLELLIHFFGATLSLSVEELQPMAPEERLVKALEAARARGALPPDFALADARRHFEVLSSLRKAMFAYRPCSYPGALLYFRASERRPEDPPAPDRAWVEMAQAGIEIQIVPGNHISMHEPPHLEVLAGRLRAALLRTQRLSRESKT